MRRFRMFVVVYTFVISGLSGVQQASASPTCESSLPVNIDAGILEPNVLALLQRSETFHQQCLRIAATPALRVRLGVSTWVEPGGRAMTIINRYEAGAIRAEVTLLFAADYVELLAHEFEHILEQVDGVNLREEVAVHRAWIMAGGAFETRRATAAGVLARQQWDEALAAEAAQADGMKAPGRRHPIH